MDCNCHMISNPFPGLFFESCFEGVRISTLAHQGPGGDRHCGCAGGHLRGWGYSGRGGGGNSGRGGSLEGRDRGGGGGGGLRGDGLGQGWMTTGKRGDAESYPPSTFGWFRGMSWEV